MFRAAFSRVRYQYVNNHERRNPIGHERPRAATTSAAEQQQQQQQQHASSGNSCKTNTNLYSAPGVHVLIENVNCT